MFSPPLRLALLCCVVLVLLPAVVVGLAEANGVVPSWEINGDLETDTIEVGESTTVTVDLHSSLDSNVVVVLELNGELVAWEPVEIEDEEATVDLEVPPQEAGLYDVTVTATAESFVHFQELEWHGGSLLVGEPEDLTLAIDLPPVLPEHRVSLLEYDKRVTATSAADPGYPVDVEDRVTLTANEEPIDRLVDWRRTDADESVTFDASLRGERASATAPVAEFWYEPTVDPFLPGETAELQLVADGEPVNESRWIDQTRSLHLAIGGQAAEVVSDGEVRALRPGEAWPVIETRSHGSFYQDRPIQIDHPVDALAVDLEPDPLTVGEPGTVTVTATYHNGTERDVTDVATLSIENESDGTLADGELVASDRGAVEVTASYQWANASATVSVTEADGLPGPPVVLVGLAVALGVGLGRARASWTERGRR